MALSFRLAVAKDAAVVRALAREAYTHYVPRMGREPAPMTADYADQIAQGLVCVAEETGGLMGILVTYPKGNHLFVENVAVATGAQGRGVGRMLLEQAERMARDASLIALELYTNEKMTENLDWYPKLGFQETARIVEDGYSRVYFLKPL